MQKLNRNFGSHTLLGLTLGLAVSAISAPTCGAAAQLTSYSYEVRVPASSSQTCDQQAASLGDRFGTATGIAVTRAICQGSETLHSAGSDYPLNTLELDYQAETEPQLYSAGFGEPEMPTSADPGRIVGVYSTYPDCVADLTSQTQLFEAQTGLLAVASFCDPADIADGGRFLLEVDGFGTPQSNLYVFDSDFTGQVDATTESQLLSLLAAQGTVLAKVAGSLHFYYAAAAVNLETDLIGFFPSAAECSTQIDDVQALFTNAGSKAVWVLCLPSATQGSTFALQAVRDSSNSIDRDFGAESKTYLSLAECLTDRGRVLQDIGAQGANVYGGICVPSDTQTGVYVLDLYEPI